MKTQGPFPRPQPCIEPNDKLALALRQDCPEAILQALASGADPTRRLGFESFHAYPLEAAQSPQAVKALLAAGANPRAKVRNGTVRQSQLMAGRPSCAAALEQET